MANATLKVGNHIVAILHHPEASYTLRGTITKVAKGIGLVQANFDDRGTGWVRISQIVSVTKS